MRDRKISNHPCFFSPSSDFPDVLTNERGFLYTPEGLVAILDWYITRDANAYRNLKTKLHRGQTSYLWRTTRRFGIPEEGRDDLYDRIQGVPRALDYNRRRALPGEEMLLASCAKGGRTIAQMAFLLHCPEARVRRLLKKLGIYPRNGKGDT